MRGGQGACAQRISNARCSAGGQPGGMGCTIPSFRVKQAHINSATAHQAALPHNRLAADMDLKLEQAEAIRREERQRAKQAAEQAAAAAGGYLAGNEGGGHRRGA